METYLLCVVWTCHPWRWIQVTLFRRPQDAALDAALDAAMDAAMDAPLDAAMDAALDAKLLVLPAISSDSFRAWTW